MSRIRLLALACVLAWLALPTPATAQVRRCVDAQGNSVFTDRPCASLGVAPREAPAPAQGAYASGFARRGCARSPGQLLDGVRGALEAHDVNRLANFYHWPGTGSGAAKSLMDALEAVAARPLVGVVLVSPDGPPDPGSAVGSPSEPTPPTPGNPPEEVHLTPFPPEEVHLTPLPTGLRVEQMAGPGDVSSRSTDFSLRQHAGCWWIEL